MKSGKLSLAFSVAYFGDANWKINLFLSSANRCYANETGRESESGSFIFASETHVSIIS